MELTNTVTLLEVFKDFARRVKTFQEVTELSDNLKEYELPVEPQQRQDTILEISQIIGLALQKALQSTFSPVFKFEDVELRMFENNVLMSSLQHLFDYDLLRLVPLEIFLTPDYKEDFSIMLNLEPNDYVILRQKALSSQKVKAAALSVLKEKSNRTEDEQIKIPILERELEHLKNIINGTEHFEINVL